MHGATIRTRAVEIPRSRRQSRHRCRRPFPAIGKTIRSRPRVSCHRCSSETDAAHLSETMSSKGAQITPSVRRCQLSSGTIKKLHLARAQHRTFVVARTNCSTSACASAMARNWPPVDAMSPLRQQPPVTPLRCCGGASCRRSLRCWTAAANRPPRRLRKRPRQRSCDLWLHGHTILCEVPQERHQAPLDGTIAAGSPLRKARDQRHKILRTWSHTHRPHFVVHLHRAGKQNSGGPKDAPPLARSQPLLARSCQLASVPQ